MRPARTQPSALANALGWANLLYLGLLPALATFGLVYRYGSPEIPGLGENTRALIGVVGFAAVAVELAVLVTYTRFPASISTALLVLVDGPVLALLGWRDDPHVLDFAIRAFVIDGTAVWLAIGALALTTPENRKVPVGIMLAMLACAGALFGPYLAHDVARTWLSLAPLILGLAWATVVNFRVLASDEVVRKGDTGPVTGYILGFAAAWLVAYGVAIAVH